MSKKLYLIRHSYAEEPGAKTDFDRLLTMEGLSTVRALGRHLLNEDFNPDIVLCSPATRTKETAINLLEELEMNKLVLKFEDSIYNASIRELFGLLNEIDKKNKQVAVIGHNPAITYLGEFLTGESIGNMEPSSIVTISYDLNEWSDLSQGSATFVSYYHPSH